MGNLVNENILVVDLSSGGTSEETAGADFLAEHLGGASANLALWEVHADGDPMVLGTGILTGTLVPGGGGGVITARSPRTGTVCHAPLSGYLAAELKYAGFDHVVVKGAARALSYLWIHDGLADLRDGLTLMGKDAWARTDHLRRALGEDVIQVISTGPAADQGNPLAQVVANYWTTADRWGLGAVLGGKNLPAIAMRGMGLFDLADEEGFMGECLALAAEARTALSGKGRGIGPLCAAMGENVDSWLSGHVHRHKADFGCPYPSNTFVKFDEDATVMAETAVAEPGMMLTDAGDLLALKSLGLSAPDAARALAACARRGVDPAAVAAVAKEQGVNSLAALAAALPGMTLSPSGPPACPLAALAPDRPAILPFPDAGPDLVAWWRRRQAVAYILGLDPRFACMSPFLTEERLVSLVNLGAGLSVSADDLSAAVARVLGEGGP